MHGLKVHNSLTLRQCTFKSITQSDTILSISMNSCRCFPLRSLWYSAVDLYLSACRLIFQEALIPGCELYFSACRLTFQEAWCSAVNLSFLFTVGITPRDALPRWARNFPGSSSATPSPQRHTTGYKVRCEENKKELQQGWNLELSSEVGSPEKLREGIRSYRFLRWYRKCCCLSIFRCEFSIFCIGFSKSMYTLMA